MFQAVAPDLTNAALDAKDAETARLRAELNDKSNQIAELQEQIAHLYGIEQSRDAAEARAEKAKAALLWFEDEDRLSGCRQRLLWRRDQRGDR